MYSWRYFDNFDNSHSSFLWPEYFIDFLMWKMDPMSGCDIRFVFTLPPRNSALQYKRCVHLWKNFPCIITLYKPTSMYSWRQCTGSGSGYRSIRTGSWTIWITWTNCTTPWKRMANAKLKYANAKSKSAFEAFCYIVYGAMCIL